MKTIGDQQLVKRINRSVLLRLLRSQGGLSRAQLSQVSGLTKSTVSLLVRELLDEGWLTENRLSGTQGLGRPSTPLFIDEQSRAMVGVELAVDALRVVAVSLTGQVRVSYERPVLSRDPLAVCEQMAALVELAHSHLTATGTQLSGVGVGVPGAFDQDTGMLRLAPNLGWRDLDLLPLVVDSLRQRALPQVPIHLLNDADAAALSEYEFADEDLGDSLVFVACGVGVGAGIVLNDRLFNGAHGMAGEIGHSVLQVDGPLCSCGRLGCAEAFFGARALSQASEPARCGRYLGVVLQNLWSTFDPGLLVVGGTSHERFPGLLDVALDTLHGFAASVGMSPPAVRPARYGLLAAAVGAAALVLHHDLRPIHQWAPVGALRPDAASDIGASSLSTA